MSFFSSLQPYLLVAILSFCFGAVTLWIFSFRRRPKDEADERRRLGNKFKPPNSIDYTCYWSCNSRRMLIFRQEFLPKSQGQKKSYNAAIGLCHGFGDHTNDMIADFAVKLCNKGFAVFTMDAEGHGFSDGVHGHIDNINSIAADLSEYFLGKLNKPEYANLPFFLYGVSMGGAVAFHLCTGHDISHHVKGVILSSPMVNIADEMKPPQIIINLLSGLSNTFPYAPITPVPSILDKCFKRKEVYLKAKQNVLGYMMKPRLHAAVQMLQATEEIAKRMHEFKHPVLLIHGGSDTVTSPKDSEIFHSKCSSKDKQLKLYPGCLHDLLNGESEEQIEVIFNDIVTWLKQRI